MPVAHRPIVLLLAAVLAASPSTGDARRHAHAAHGGWMHARVAAMRGWFRRAAHVPTQRVAAAPAHRRGSSARPQRAAEPARLAARRREDVDAYLRDHPVFAAAN